VLVQAGERATAGRIGLLAASGLREVKARRRPSSACWPPAVNWWNPATRCSGKTLRKQSTRAGTLIAQSGGLPHLFPLVADTLAATKQA